MFLVLILCIKYSEGFNKIFILSKIDMKISVLKFHYFPADFENCYRWIFLFSENSVLKWKIPPYDISKFLKFSEFLYF